MTKKCNRLRGERPKAFWGALVGGAMNLIGSAISSKSQARAIRRQIEAQKEAARTQLELANNSNLASTLNSYAAATRSYNNEDDYNLKYRLGGNKRLGSNRIYITDGGNATKIENDTFLLRGGSHEQTNETGQTGIGINVGGNEIEAEGGEVAQKKNGAIRIFSAQPILDNGMSPAQAVMSGANKDKVFSAQQSFKKRNGLEDDGGKAAFGNLFTIPFSDTARKLVEYFSGTGRYASKPVKVTPKTVAKKPIRNGQVGNFRIVNGKRIPNEKPLRRVYPEFDVISIGRGLPIKRSLKNTIGFVSKPNTFTRGIGGREGIKDLVESKVVRGNPVGTEMTAKAYSKATKSNRNNFNDIMNGTGRKDISHRYYNRSLSKEDFDAIQESYNKINTSFKARHPKASGKIRFAIGDDVYDPLGNYKNYDDYLAQIASDRKSLRNATTINPDNGEPIAYFYNDGRNPLTQGHGYASSKWGVRISNPQDYNMKIFDGHLHYSNSKTIPFDSPNVEVFRSTPLGTIRYPKWMLRRGWYRNGGLTSKDRGSSKHPYPSVSSKDFAGGGRSYPIPTKADAVDALRLAGLHGRSDVKSKVYDKYPSLRKKSLLGSYSRPVKGMRTKFAIGGKEDEGYDMTGELSPVITTARYRTPSFTTVDTAARAIPNFGTIKVPAYVPPSTVPYIGQDYNRSRTIFTGGDYLGLGIDTLSALGTGLITSNAYKNLDFNYNLPNFVEESPVALNTTYHNEAQKSNVERNRLNSRNSILRNTMSGSTAVGRMQGVDTNALYQLNQLADEKTNKETELMNQNLLNEQQVRARNAAARNQYYNTVANIKNAALEAKNNASLARSQAFSTSLSGLSQAWNNFYTSGRTAYEDDQARRAMIASSKDATPTRLIEMGYNLSPQVIASLYNTSTDQRTKNFYLSMLDEKQRRKYGIS